MDLIGTHGLDPEEVRRAAKMAAEMDDRIDVGSLRRRRQIADLDVLDHALTQRAQLGHRVLLSARLGLDTHNLVRRETSGINPALLLPRSGLVQTRRGHVTPSATPP